MNLLYFNLTYSNLSLRSGITVINDRIERCSYCQLKTDANTPVGKGEISFPLPISVRQFLPILTHLSLPLDVKFNKVGKLEKRSDVPNTMHYFASIQPNVFSPALTVIAENGNVILESQDWAASMGLKLAHPKYTPSTL